MIAVKGALSTQDGTQAVSEAGLRPERLDPLADSRWHEFVEREPAAGIFHHPAWLGVLSEQYAYPVHASCVIDTSGAVVGGVPIAEIRSRLTGRRLVSLPFSDACLPVCGGDSAEVRATIVRELEAERVERGLTLELRGEFPLPSGEVRHRFYQHLLTLGPDLEAVERHFSKSQVRAAVRKARKTGVKVARRTDREALEAFYRLHLQTRRRLGVPTQPKSFIMRLARLFEAGLGFVLLAELDGDSAAAAVFFTYKRTITYKYGASDPRFLKQRPNNLLFWEAIRWGCENGFEQLDFGRSDLDNEGLRRFKSGWGAQELELSYTYAPRPAPSFEASRVERLLTATLKRSPAPVGRILGEALYRHYG